LPTAAPATWLEAAAKLDALAGEKVPLSVARTTPTLPDVTKGGDAADEATVETPQIAARPVSRLPADAPEAKPRPRIAVPPAVIPESVINTTEETDVMWQGYSPAAMLPSTLILAVVTISAIIILRPLVPKWVLHEAADAPLAALWILQGIRAAYRLFCYDYRLTTRRLFRNRGRLYPADAPLDLALVTRAEVRQTVFGRMTGIGDVRVNREDSTAAIELTGVRRPKLLATKIEEAATAARGANVLAARLTSEPESSAPVGGAGQ
jgi:hypothetical protein